jgi:hypothetical protein
MPHSKDSAETEPNAVEHAVQAGVELAVDSMLED